MVTSTRTATDRILMANALRPSVTVVMVAHDDRCAHWRGQGCDCAAVATLASLADAPLRPAPRRPAQGRVGALGH